MVILRLVVSATLALIVGCAPVADVGNLHIVEEGVLLRSAQPSALGLAYLRDRYGVQTVINLTGDTTDSEMTTVLALGLDYIPLPLSTYGLEREKLPVVLAAIRQAEAAGRVPVLIHCHSGQDRTGVAVAVFRVVEQGVSGEDAQAEMQRYRHWTHKVLFPHLDDVPLHVDAFEPVWAESVRQTGSVPVIRPAMAWVPSHHMPAAPNVDVTTSPSVR